VVMEGQQGMCCLIAGLGMHLSLAQALPLLSPLTCPSLYLKLGFLSLTQTLLPACICICR
jgi:hypothetical protein